MRKTLFRTTIALCVAALAVFAYWQWLNLPPDVPIPTPVLPSPNGHDALWSAGLLEKRNDDVRLAVASPKKGQRVYTLAEKEALIAQNQAALTAFQSARQLPYWNPPDRSADFLVKELSKYRALAFLVALDAAVKAEQGDHSGAVNTCLDGIQMSLEIPRGGTVLYDVVGIACEAICAKKIWRQIDSLDGASAEAAARRLNAIASGRVPFCDTLREEKWTDEAMLVEAFKNKSVFAAYRDPKSVLAPAAHAEGDNGLSAAKAMADYKFLATHSKRRIIADFSRQMDDEAAQSLRPYPQNIIRSTVTGDPFSANLTEDFAPAQYQDLDVRMQSGLLNCALGLRAYRLRHGDYPVSLAGLAEFGVDAHAISDPFAASASTPFRYRRISVDKYLLYGVGADGVDDGGKPVDLSKSDEPLRTFPKEGDKGDWVVGDNIALRPAAAK